MTVTIISEEAVGGGQYEVVLESETRAELTGQDPQRVAVRAAEMAGISRAALVAPFSVPYPVNNEGETSDAITNGEEPVSAYRRKILLSRGI